MGGEGRPNDSSNDRGSSGGRQSGQNSSAQDIVSNMTPDRFERMRNSPFAERVKEQVGSDRWAQWERGDFTSSASAAEQAAAAAEGRSVETEMTEEERRLLEEQLRSGTVPDFTFGESYSLEAENEYMQQAIARRDDTLVPSAPVSIRFYARYFIGKYDSDGNGQLERSEWEDIIDGAQAIDLDGDWILTDQEVLFYLARYAKGRTIANPRPVQPQRTNLIVEQEDRPLLIRTASAAPRVSTQEVADEERNKQGEFLDPLSDEEFVQMLTEDNPAMESVDDKELLDVLLSDMDESSVREYAPAPESLIGAPVWFLARDVNGDGQLSLREFAPNLTPAAVAKFGQFDLNADGFITVEEVKQVLGGSGG